MENLDFEKKGKWGSNLPKEEVEKSQKRAKLWVELREKYPDDEELKNLSMEDMGEKDYWFKKYGVTECF